MKLTKKLSRIAATVLALALLVCTAAVPAMANPVTDHTSAEDSVSSFTITKNLTKEATTMVPNTTFNFTVSVATVTNETRNGVPVSSGIEDGVTFASGAVFTPGNALNNATSVSAEATFNVDETKFTTPGIYKYTISEDNDGYDAITYDTNVLDLYVYVQNMADGSVGVAYTELVDPNGGTSGGEAKTDSFTNDYDSIPKNQLHDLTLYKVVSGNAANMSEEFEFQVTINGETGEKYYVEKGTYTDADGFVQAQGADNSAILTSGKTETFTLGNADAIKIYALDSDDTYTIEELNDNTNGYKLEVNGVANNTGVTTGSLTGDDTIKYENIKNTDTPTGVIMDVAPYALMVVVAVVAGVVFLGKRRED